MNILVLAAHPDDEALGCGGTIARHAANGDHVTILFLADGVTSRKGGKDHLAGRYQSAKDAAKILGADQPRFLEYFDQRLDQVPFLDLVQHIEAELKYIPAPQIVYTHHAGDLNRDHQITHQATMTVFRPIPESTVSTICAYEVASSTSWGTGQDFVPNKFVDISGYITQKRDALMAYGDEIKPLPHARSLEAIMALAAHRGNTVGLQAAEAFVIVRDIQR
jgi:LmbE family N-acetylglucosaminyl deacetylase